MIRDRLIRLFPARPVRRGDVLPERDHGEQVHVIPVAHNMTVGQAWEALDGGAHILYAPPDDDTPCPLGGGWAIVLTMHGEPVGVWDNETGDWLSTIDADGYTLPGECW